MVIVREIGVARACAVVGLAVTLAGCDCLGRGFAVTRSAGAGISSTPAASPPLPRRALLIPQPAPNCEPASAEPTLDERQKLDYQRQCYRHAEMIVRERLQRLQVSVGRTIKAVGRSERDKQ